MTLRTIQGVEELRTLVGQELATSDWLEVKQEMIDAFAEVTGDHQWIHVDPDRAKRESPFGATIAHGFLTLSLITRLHNQAVRVEGDKKMGINYGLNRVRFVNPVRAGSRIRSHSAVKAVEDFPNGAPQPKFGHGVQNSGDKPTTDFPHGVQVTWLITVELENSEKPALAAEWVTRIYQ
jgi:acyl dehydratase